MNRWRPLFIGMASFVISYPVRSFALSTTVNGITWTYTVSGYGASVGGGSSTAIPTSTIGEVVIPSRLGGLPVKSIGANAFKNCSGLTAITIPVSVTNIGSYAFNNCSGLTSVPIATEVTSIGSGAFFGCTGLVSATIPANVTRIEYGTFSGCTALSSVTIPDGVTDIGNRAFYNCAKLASISIPISVTNIGSDVFYGCPDSLFDTTIPGVCLIDGWVVGHDGSLSGALDLSGIRGIAVEAFRNCSGITSVTIPDTVTSIGDRAFIGCSRLRLFSVDIDNPKYSSSNGLLLSKNGSMLIEGVNGDVTIPFGVTNIGDRAFYNLSGLTSVTIPDSVTIIEDYAFCNCIGLSSIVIPSSVTSIGDYAFRDCTTLASISIPDSVTRIGSGAFDGDSALHDTSTISGVQLVAGWAIGFSSLSGSLDLTGIRGIGNNAFRGCSGLTSVMISDSVKTIGNSAFSGCSGLTSVMISDSVTSIGSWAFEGCSALTSVIIPDSVTSICDYTFRGCTRLTSIDISYGVTSIGYCAFDQCSSLTHIDIPTSMTNIGAYAFNYCTSLGSITIPSSVTSIGERSFSGCSKLKLVTLSDSLKSIGEQAFYENPNLSETHIIISDLAAWCTNSINYNLTGLRRLFLAGEEITEIVIPDNVTRVGGNAFAGCTRVTSITIPNTVTMLGYYAFRGCSGLTSIMIPASVTNIENYVFLGSSSLATIYLPKTLEGRKSALNAPNECDIVLYDHLPTLTIFSPHGSGYPEVGETMYNEFSLVAAYTICPVAEEGVQYTYMGWTGTGSVPESGTETNVSFVIYENSTLTWNWRKNNKISVSASGQGTCDFGIQWIEDGTVTTATIHPTTHLFDITLIGDTDGVTVSGATLTIPSNKPRSITVEIKETLLDFSVVSEHGATEPETGFHSYAYGTRVSASSHHETIEEGVRWACIGWSGIGSVPSTGTGTNFEFTIQENSSLTWLWEKQNSISVIATGKGTCNFGTQWVAEGTMATATIIPDELLFGIILEDDTNDVTCEGTTLSIPSDRTRSVAVNVLGAEDVIENGGIPLDYRLDGTNVGWQIAGDVSAQDGFSLRSAAIDANETSAIEVMVTGTGVLSFDWRISSARGHHAQFYVDGNLTNTITRSTDWASVVVALDDGPHVMRWTYEKGSGSTAGEDAAFLDNLCWTPLLLTIESALNATNVLWSTNGDALWFPQLAVSEDGEGAARSGAVVGDATSRLTATVTGPGTLAWSWKTYVQGNAGVDVFLDGVWLDDNGLWLEGSVDWTTAALTVEGAGEHTVVFEFWNAGTDVTISDCAYLDCVSWTPTESGGLLPELASEASAEAVTNAIEVAGLTDMDGVLAAIGGNAVNYNSFRTWAQGAAGGESAVAASAYAGVSYLLGAAAPFENEPEIKFACITIEDRTESATTRRRGGFDSLVTLTVRVSVRDGADVATVSAEKVAQMFEATSNLDDWTGDARLNLVVSFDGRDSDGSMRFTVAPGDGTEGCAFLRIRVQ